MVFPDLARRYGIERPGNCSQGFSFPSLQLAFHPAPATLSFYHSNLFCLSCAAYCAVLYYLSSPSSLAQKMEIWLPPQMTTSLVASKRDASQREARLATKSTLKWALNRRCKLAIFFIADLIALSRAVVDRLARYSSFSSKTVNNSFFSSNVRSSSLMLIYTLPSNEATYQYKSIPHSIWGRPTLVIKSSCSQLVFWPFGLCP